MLYDDSRFFQWLEGPPEGVDRVMHSIHNDRRHTDVEILTRRSATTRRFDGWDMKLAAPGATALAWQDDAIETPSDIIENLRSRPEAAPSLLVKLVPLTASATRDLDDDAASQLHSPLGQTAAAVLKAVIVESVIPLLLQQHAGASGRESRSGLASRASELAELLVAPDQAAALQLIRELRGRDGDARLLYAPLFEPAARSLGDLWSEDICSEFEVTLGLCRLQTAVRLLGADVAPPVFRPNQPSLLIAPVPGELHDLVSAMDSEWLWSTGWTPQIAFPADDRALEELVSESWIDVLDLSLSAAFRREDSLPRLASTIVKARHASRNPQLLVMVGGRAFVEDGAAGAGVGADLSSRTSHDLDRRIMDGMRRGDAAQGADDPAAQDVELALRHRLPPARRARRSARAGRR